LSGRIVLLVACSCHVWPRSNSRFEKQAARRSLIAMEAGGSTYGVPHDVVSGPDVFVLSYHLLHFTVQAKYGEGDRRGGIWTFTDNGPAIDIYTMMGIGFAKSGFQDFDLSGDRAALHASQYGSAGMFQSRGGQTVRPDRCGQAGPILALPFLWAISRFPVAILSGYGSELDSGVAARLHPFAKSPGCPLDMELDGKIPSGSMAQK